ncbi:uncharacterized protein LOC129598579 [Paramacrobiotus metropolitanus]|uniref:uncharacterized protein LOC129598579 n=1 Tax=Paramacrobiotus metropolitanus TaxID=2943436 RepID=UPI002445B82A|nr:uncharacterized protein LOC129598579 [Paramacrobiotus metropolitanus]
MGFDPDRPFIIRHDHTNTVLDVFNGSDQNKQQIVFYQYNGGPNQRFTYRNGFIYSQKNGLVLDVDRHPGCEMRITTYSPNGGPNQRWRIKESGRIKSECGDDLVIEPRHPDHRGSCMEPGVSSLLTAHVGQKRKRDDSQKFTLVNV